MSGSVINHVKIESICKVDTTQFIVLFCGNLLFFHSIFCFNFAALKVAGGCRPAGRALCVSRADGQRVGQSEAARHCDEHSVQKGLHG